jgi:hypothetical protein
MSWNRKPSLKASAIAPLLLGEALDLAAAQPHIVDFADDANIDAVVLTREFRLLKLYMIETAIQNIASEQEGGERLLREFNRWIGKIQECVATISDVHVAWPERRAQYDEAWAHQENTSTRIAIGDAFSRACGDRRFVLSSFAGDMFTVLLGQYIERLRELRIADE